MANISLFDFLPKSQIEQVLEESVSQTDTSLFLLDQNGRILLQVNPNNHEGQQINNYLKQLQSIDALSKLNKEVKRTLTFSCNEYHKLYAKSIFCDGHFLGAIASCQAGENGFDTQAVGLSSPKDVSKSSKPTQPKSFAQQLTFLTARRLEDLVTETSDLDSLSSEIARNYEEINLLYAVSKMLGGVMRVDKACEIILHQAMETIGVEKASIMLLDNDTNELYISTAKGIPTEIISRTRVKIGEGICGWVAEQGEALLVNDVIQRDALKDKIAPSRYRTESFLSFPLLVSPMKVKTDVLGVINMTDKISGENFTAGDGQLLEAIATQAAAAIMNGKLYDDLKELFFDTVAALASAIDAKDPYTHGHSSRVSEISIEISKELGLSEEDIEDVRLASLLHDIGKIGVPESVLLKPSKLDDNEWVYIRKHPKQGADIIKCIRVMNRAIIDGVKHHHERPDGTGYPDKLSQRSIPLIAKIISVADAFDAMTSDRAYRSGAMSDEEAIVILKKCTGTQFSSEIVEAFLAAYNRLKNED